jgi:hypothetical protein
MDILKGIVKDVDALNTTHRTIICFLCRAYLALRLVDQLRTPRQPDNSTT